MPNKLVRCGLHLEMQKHGKLPDPTRPALKRLRSSETVAEKGVENGTKEVGIDLSYAENRALFAVQRLLDNTDYKGNIEPFEWLSTNPYLYNGIIPRVSVSVADYLRAYRLYPYDTHRGKEEFSGTARKAAVDALRRLSGKRFLLCYDRKCNSDISGNIQKPDHIEVIDTLIGLEERRGKLLITPNPIMVDQIDNYFLWKPADLYIAILDGKDKCEALFMEYLFYLYEMNRRNGVQGAYVVKRQPEVMAHVLHMDSLLAARQKSRIRARLTRLYNIAEEAEYLEKYEIDVPGAKVKELDCLYLNKETFKEMRDGLPAN